MLLAKWCQELGDDGRTQQISGESKNLVKKHFQYGKKSLIQKDCQGSRYRVGGVFGKFKVLEE